MARINSKFTCTACDARLAPGDAACSQCGHPTPHATMEQRVLWELNRWQETRPPAAAEPEPPAVHRLTAAPPAEAAPLSREASRNGVVSEQRTAPARHAGNGAAAATTYEIHAEVGTAEAPSRHDVPLVVRRLPVAPHPPALAPHPPAPGPAAGGVAASAVAPELVEQDLLEPDPAAHQPVVEVLQAPVKESRKERKARERAEREAEEAAHRHAEELEREEARRRKEEAVAAAEARRLAREAERAEREAERRARPTRAQRRSDKKHRRLTEGITLHDGETITLTLSGWSRGRPAVLVITRFRVALITKLPHSLRWIPLEEVSKTALRWRGGWTLEIEGSVEYLTLQKRSKQMLSSIREVLTSEVAEARAPGGRRHHPEVTQDWCDRSIEMWETHAGQIRLFIRRHPVLVVLTLSVWVPVAYYFALR